MTDTGASEAEALPLQNLLRKLQSLSKREVPDEMMTFDFERGGHAYRIIFESIEIRESGGQMLIQNCELWFLEK